LNVESRNLLVPEIFESGSQEPSPLFKKFWFVVLPAFLGSLLIVCVPALKAWPLLRIGCSLIRFFEAEVSITDEAAASDEALVWDRVSGLEWVLA